MRFGKHDLIMKIIISISISNIEIQVSICICMLLSYKKKTKQLIVQLLNAQIRKMNTGVDQKVIFGTRG